MMIISRDSCQSWGLIYNRCVRTKQALKEAYATSDAQVVIYKNKLHGKICAPARKLWPMRTNVLEMEQFGDTDGELELNVFLVTFRQKIKKIKHIQKDNTNILSLTKPVTWSKYPSHLKCPRQRARWAV